MPVAGLVLFFVARGWDANRTLRYADIILRGEGLDRFFAKRMRLVNPFDGSVFLGFMRPLGRGDWRGRRWAAYTTVRKVRSEVYREVLVVAVWSPIRLPEATLAYATPWNAVVAGRGNVVETEYGEFNQRWRVFSRRRRELHAILSPTAVERLMAPELRDGVLMLGGNTFVLEVGEDLSSAPRVVDALIDVIDGIPAAFGGGALPRVRDAR
ncbi:hypothetical protein [Demequina sp. NBRC 110054]|uniref:hypothetical protein n=1 Tax=Demequina sp. NBRC 110054 TaxID=1570343 RepID=UPI001178492B|nr:hypothetical protein [Demequina sp. NBRC 110054]